MIVTFLYILFLPSQYRGFPVSPKGCMVETGLEEEALKEEGRRAGEEAGYDKDLSERRGPFRNLVGQTDTLTVQLCVERCWLQRYDFAAMQGGTRCYCSRSVGGLSKLNDTACYDRCSGNCLQRCGGAIAMSIYETGYERLGPVTKSSSLRYAYLGCYDATYLMRLCHQKPGDSYNKPILQTGRMTAMVCALYCSSYPAPRYVAVVSTPNTCCCGISSNEANSIDRDREGKMCPTPCAGGGEPKCVGQRRISAFGLAGWLVRRPSGIPRTVMSDFGKGSGWLWPEFPDNNFEVNKESLPPQPEPDEPDPETDIKDLAGPMLGRPIIEPDNAGVKVVDKPEEEEESSGSSVGVTVGVVICCLAIMGAVLFVVVGQKKDTTSDTEKAIALMQTTQSAGDTVPERGKEEKKRKKNKKNKKGKTDVEQPDTTDENEAAKEPLLMA